MNKDNARKVIEEMLREHPDLVTELTQPKPLSAKERKPVVTTIRTSVAIKERLLALKPRLEGGGTVIDYQGKLSLSDVIREALERGVSELERLAEKQS